MEIQISRLAAEDAAGVFKIESKVFASRWTQEMLLNEISSKNSYYLKARADGRLAGYTGVQLVLEQAHITTLAVAQNLRKQGIGTALVKKILDDLIKKGVKHFSLEVRVSNAEAQQIYAKFNFKVISRRKDYYQNPAEDALLMVWDV